MDIHSKKDAGSADGRPRKRIPIGKIAGLLIAVFWLAATGWLIRYEAFPEWFVGRRQSYRGVFDQGLFVLDSWMRIYLHNQPVGYTHTWVDSDTVDGRQLFMLRNQTALALNLMGSMRSVNVTLGATLDDAYNLADFFAVMMADGYQTRMDGHLVGPERFRVTIRTPGATRETEVVVPADALIHTPLTEMLIGDLPPGQSMILRVFNPLTLSTDEVRVTAVNREKITVAGQEYDTTLLRTFYQGMEMRSWVDRQGRAVRQETPFGLTMEVCTADEAVLPEAGAPLPADMLTALAVPCDGLIINPYERPELEIVLHGVAGATSRPTGDRVRILESQDDWMRLRLFRQTPPPEEGFADPPDDLEGYLAPSPALQSDNPEVVAKANAIAAGRSPGWDVVRDINNWLHANITKEAAISLPSAVDVLQQRVGDCNEHTYLFVALARALGMPARIHVGLVYAELDNTAPAFYYHAWPAVWINGEWVEMDPTLGQDMASATHITLATGELDRQVQILGFMGRLRISVPEEPAN